MCFILISQLNYMNKFWQTKQKTHSKKTIIAILFASLFSAVAAIFLTPVGGKEARNAARSKTEDLSKKVKDLGNSISSKTKNLIVSKKDKVLKVLDEDLDNK